MPSAAPQCSLQNKTQVGERNPHSLSSFTPIARGLAFLNEKRLHSLLTTKLLTAQPYRYAGTETLEKGRPGAKESKESQLLSDPNKRVSKFYSSSNK